MKIYLADTIQRDYLGHIEKMGGDNHLESYFAIITKNSDIKEWAIFKDKDEDLLCS